MSLFKWRWFNAKTTSSDIKADTGTLESPDQLLTSVQADLTQGQARKALATLKLSIHNYPTHMGVNQALHRLLIALNEQKTLRKHTPLYIGLLLQSHEADKALAVFQQTYEAIPQFELEAPALVLQLAKTAQAHDCHETIIALTHRLHERTGTHGAIPWCYYLLAKTLNEYKKDVAGAQHILRYIQAHYPNHPIIPKVQSAQMNLERRATG